jgi:hypothetical protein
MMDLTRETLEELVLDADLDTEENIYWDYSGRWGLRSDFNLVGDASALASFFVQLTKLDGELAFELARNIPVDDMGRDSIFSFPGLSAPKETDDSEA